jgi:hypothetical protein
LYHKVSKPHTLSVPADFPRDELKQIFDDRIEGMIALIDEQTINPLTEASWRANSK